MDNFFDKNLLQNIIVSFVFLLISILLSRKTQKTTSGKKSKVVVILSYFMILGGIYMMTTSFRSGTTVQSSEFGVGLVATVAGLVLLALGRFFVWWQR